MRRGQGPRGRHAACRALAATVTVRATVSAPRQALHHRPIWHRLKHLSQAALLHLLLLLLLLHALPPCPCPGPASLQLPQPHAVLLTLRRQPPPDGHALPVAVAVPVGYVVQKLPASTMRRRSARLKATTARALSA